MLEQQEIAVLVLRATRAAPLQQEEGRQRVTLGRGDDRVGGHRLGQPHRFGADVGADDALAFARAVALVEQQVEHLEHRVAPSRDRGGLGHFVGQGAGADELLRARDALGDRRFAGEEPARDLAHREAAHHLERQRHARVGRDLGMTADEDETELIVLDLTRERGLGGALEPRLDQRGDVGALGRDHAAAPEHVERAVVGDAGEPGAGVGRSAGERPALERLHHRVLHRLLGEVEALGAEHADQARHQSPRLAAEEVVDQGVDGTGTSHGTAMLTIVRRPAPGDAFSPPGRRDAARCGRGT